jgi:hypothetical protein
MQRNLIGSDGISAEGAKALHSPKTTKIKSSSIYTTVSLLLIDF